MARCDARQMAVEEYHDVLRAVLPGLLIKPAGIRDPRNPRSIEHRLTVVLL